MHFTHRADPARSATVEPAAGPALVFRYTDPRGKHRKKTFKGSGKRKDDLGAIWFKLLRFAAREGWVAPAPQPAGSPIAWLSMHHLDSYGTLAFALDRARQRSWLYQWRPGAFLLAVERGSCAEIEQDLRPIDRVRALSCAADGDLYASLYALKRGRPETPAWLWPAEGSSSVNLVRLEGGHTPHLLASLPTGDFDHMLDAVSAADDGRVLGPHRDGAAVYQPDGRVIETHPVGKLAHWFPQGALSADGRWLTLTASASAVRTRNRDTGAESLYGPFEQVLRLAIHNDGTTWIHGFGPAGWAIYRARNGALEAVCDQVHAQVSPCGERILAVRDGLATLLRIGRTEPVASWQLPQLVGKHGRVRFWDRDHAVVRMGGHTPLLELDLTVT